MVEGPRRGFIILPVSLINWTNYLLLYMHCENPPPSDEVLQKKKKKEKPEWDSDNDDATIATAAEVSVQEEFHNYISRILGFHSYKYISAHVTHKSSGLPS